MQVSVAQRYVYNDEPTYETATLVRLECPLNPCMRYPARVKYTPFYFLIIDILLNGIASTVLRDCLIILYVFSRHCYCSRLIDVL